MLDKSFFFICWNSNFYNLTETLIHALIHNCVWTGWFSWLYFSNENMVGKMQLIVINVTIKKLYLLFKQIIISNYCSFGWKTHFHMRFQCSRKAMYYALTFLHTNLCAVKKKRDAFWLTMTQRSRVSLIKQLVYTKCKCINSTSDLKMP